MIRLLIAAALVALPGAALAQATPAPTPAASAAPATDICSSGLSAVVSRPTATTSVCTVKPNQILIESGFQSQTVTVTGGSYTYQTFPTATIRVGTVVPHLELQVLTPSVIRNQGQSLSSDLGVGAKWQVVSEPTFSWGVSAIATAPTGTNPALNPQGLGSATDATYIYNLDFEGSLGKVFGYGAGISSQSLVVPTGTGTTRYFSVLPSLDITAALPASWTLVGEIYYQTNGEGPNTPTHTWFDAAILKDIGKAQFDVNYGVSNGVQLFAGAPYIRRHYIGAGISYLF